MPEVKDPANEVALEDILEQLRQLNSNVLLVNETLNELIDVVQRN